MYFQSPPDFDSFWDYAHPDRTERRFREILLQIPENEAAFLELLTQIARAQGLQHKYEHAHQTLHQVERRLGDGPSRPRIRYLLERGRVFNSSGFPEQARPFFEQALDTARQISEDYYVVDALHMLAIAAAAGQSLALNLQAIQFAERSKNEKAHNWLSSLYNNTGWSYHDAGDYASALEMFKKAEAWRRSRGSASEVRIAVWCVGRSLRSLKRFEQALSRQMELLKEFDSLGEKDGYVYEEIGECLLALDRSREACPYFSEAYQILSQDPALMLNDPQRLARLRTLAG